MQFRIFAVVSAVIVIAAFAWAIVQERGEQPPGGGATYSEPAAAAATASSGSAQQTVTVRNGSAPRIYYVGDSLSVNWLTSAPSAGFRELLTRRLHGRQVDVVAYAGHTVAQTLSIMSEQPTRAADLLVVELGTNDIARQIDPAESASDFARLVSVARSHAPGAALLCMGPWNNALAEASLRAAMTPVRIPQLSASPRRVPPERSGAPAHRRATRVGGEGLTRRTQPNRARDPVVRSVR